MKEDFLHYLWKFQKFDTGNLTTTNGQPLTILNPGGHNHNAGPDFFNAQLYIGGQQWAGNVEIHTKSSQWYAHQHDHDGAYNTVILHVVWEHDTEVFRHDGTAIPTVALQSRVHPKLLEGYRALFAKSTAWVPCEDRLPYIDSFLMDHWLERLFIERLERKSNLLHQQLKATHNDWEALLFRLLCKNFGLKVNGDAFLSMAQSLDFSIVKKCSQDSFQLEALLLGQAQLLQAAQGDAYYTRLKREYAYLQHKFNLDNSAVIPPKFFRLRPASFPTIRLSQVAQLYAKGGALFSKVVHAGSLTEVHDIFRVSASDYWTAHYNFGTAAAPRKKNLSQSFVELLLVNTLLPLRFSFGAYQGRDETEMLMAFARQLKKEKNSVIEKFSALQVPVANAQQSQGLLQLKNEYCDKRQCLQCAIGNSLLAQAR